MRIDPSGVVRDEVMSVSNVVDNVVGSADQKVPEVQKGEDSQDNIQDMLNSFKKKLEKLKMVFNTEAEFRIDRDTGMIVVKIKDKDTGEIIRQIPPEVMVRLAKTIDEFLGLLLDERA